MTNRNYVLFAAIFSTLCLFAFSIGTPTLPAQFGDDFLGNGGSGDSEARARVDHELKLPKGRRPQVQAEERVLALHRFSLDLYRELAGGENLRNENIACSPWSVAVTLGMIFEGADGGSAKEIRKALRIQGRPKPFEKFLFMVAFNARARNVEQNGETAPLLFETARSFWIRSDYEFLEDYRDRLEDRFQADCFEIDFDDETAGIINTWCSEKTREVVREIVTEDDLTPERRMVTVDAVYFEARWEKAFEKFRTKPEWFHYADGSVGKTAMMNEKEAFAGYLEMPGLKILRKDYSGNAHMLFLLPDGGDGLAELEASLTPRMLRRIDRQMNVEIVNIKIPRFSFENGLDMIPALKALGVESAFDMEKADLSKMTTEENFFIDFLRQKSVIKVDEEGTVAAAVTMSGGAWGGRPPVSRTFYADRPFLFLIRENTDGNILFIGRVHRPEAASE